MEIVCSYAGFKANNFKKRELAHGAISRGDTLSKEFQFYNYEMYPNRTMHIYSPNDQYYVPSYEQQYQQHLQMSYYNQTAHFQPSANYFH